MERDQVVCFLVTSDEARQLTDHVLTQNIGKPFPIAENVDFALDMMSGGVLPLSNWKFAQRFQHLMDLIHLFMVERKSSAARKTGGR